MTQQDPLKALDQSDDNRFLPHDGIRLEFLYSLLHLSLQLFYALG